MIGYHLRGRHCSETPTHGWARLRRGWAWQEVDSTPRARALGLVVLLGGSELQAGGSAELTVGLSFVVILRWIERE